MYIALVLTGRSRLDKSISGGGGQIRDPQILETFVKCFLYMANV